MSIFLAAASALLILAVILAQRLRAAVRRDSLGLRAARREQAAELSHRVAQQRNRDLMYLRLSPSLLDRGRADLARFDREDR